MEFKNMNTKKKKDILEHYLNQKSTDEILDLDALEQEQTVDGDNFEADCDEKENTVKEALTETGRSAVYDGAAAERKNMRKKEQKRARNKRITTSGSPLLLLSVLLSFVTLAVLLLCFYLLYILQSRDTAATSQQVVAEENVSDNRTYRQEEVDEMVLQASEDGSSRKEEEIKEYVKSVASVKNPNFSEMLRQMYPEDIVFLDTDGYDFVPIEESLLRHNLDADKLIKDENGNYSYIENGTITSSRGIDVSQHQGNIDWKQVADSGVSFAVIRVGFRGYGSGALVEDEQFRANVEGALEAGLDIGVYFFTQAVSEEEAAEEARFVLDAISPYSISGPVVIDVEKPDDSSARGNSITCEQRTAFVKIFCEAVSAEGYAPMIYGNTYSMFSMLDLTQLTKYDKWYAFYNDYLYYPYEVRIWQYSASAEVPGIQTSVDMNIRFKSN